MHCDVWPPSIRSPLLRRPCPRSRREEPLTGGVPGNLLRTLHDRGAKEVPEGVLSGTMTRRRRPHPGGSLRGFHYGKRSGAPPAGRAEDHPRAREASIALGEVVASRAVKVLGIHCETPPSRKMITGKWRRVRARP